MKIAITGASGFIGTHVAESLRSNGYETELLHQSDFTDENTEALRRKLSQCSGVINLAGATIAGRWSKKNKKRIYDSRIDTTRKLVDTINSLEEKPKVLINASAIGFYPSKGVHDESASADPVSFLSHVTQDWEAQARRVSESVRLVILRFGIVLGADGGIVPTILKSFSKGLWVIFGNGKQPFCWIHIDDLMDIILKMLSDSSLDGVFNCVSPEVSDMIGFTENMVECSDSIICLKLPALFLKPFLLGGADLLTKGQHAIPKRLQEIGYQFHYTRLIDALYNICGEYRHKVKKAE